MNNLNMQSEPMSSLDLKAASLGARPQDQTLHAKFHISSAAKDPFFLGLSGTKKSTNSLFSVASSSDYRVELDKIAVVDRANAAVRESAAILSLYSSEMRDASDAALSSKKKSYPMPLHEDFFGMDTKNFDMSSVVSAAGQTTDLEHLQVALKRCYDYFGTFASEFAPNAPEKVITTAGIKKKVQSMDVQLQIAMKKAGLVKEMMEGTIQRCMPRNSCHRAGLRYMTCSTPFHVTIAALRRYIACRSEHMEAVGTFRAQRLPPSTPYDSVLSALHRAHHDDEAAAFTLGLILPHLPPHSNTTPASLPHQEAVRSITTGAPRSY